jgi:hypothetical protein
MQIEEFRTRAAREEKQEGGGGGFTVRSFYLIWSRVGHLGDPSHRGSGRRSFTYHE